MVRQFLAIAAMLLPSAAQAQDSPSPAPPLVLAQRATFDFAEFAPPVPEPQAAQPVASFSIDEQGVVRLGDRAVAPLMLSAALAEIAVASAERNNARLAFVVAGDLPIDTVMPVLQKLGQANLGYLDLVGSDAFSRFGPTNDLPRAPARGPAFTGPAARYEYGIFVDALGPGGECRAIGHGWVLGGLYLYDHAFTTLDGWVQAAGGTAAIVATWDRYPVSATIQTTPHTAWRCIGGAIHHLQNAGYPTIRIELVPATN